MYVRIARFEGGSGRDIEAEIAEMRKGIEAVRLGHPDPYAPRELTRLTRRIEVFTDRDNGKVAVAAYCDTEEDLREVDRIMSEMSPQSPGWGRRVSADTYEVALEESTALRAA